MGKLLIWALLIFVAYSIWSSVSRARRQRADVSRSEMPTETMVACAFCAVNVPRSEAVEQFGKLYCSIEHSLEKRV